MCIFSHVIQHKVKITPFNISWSCIAFWGYFWWRHKYLSLSLVNFLPRFICQFPHCVQNQNMSLPWEANVQENHKVELNCNLMSFWFWKWIWVWRFVHWNAELPLGLLVTAWTEGASDDSYIQVEIYKQNKQLKIFIQFLIGCVEGPLQKATMNMNNIIHKKKRHNVVIKYKTFVITCFCEPEEVLPEGSNLDIKYLQRKN